MPPRTPPPADVDVTIPGADVETLLEELEAVGDRYRRAAGQAALDLDAEAEAALAAGEKHDGRTDALRLARFLARGERLASLADTIRAARDGTPVAPTRSATAPAELPRPPAPDLAAALAEHDAAVEAAAAAGALEPDDEADEDPLTGATAEDELGLGPDPEPVTEEEAQAALEASLVTPTVDPAEVVAASAAAPAVEDR